MYLVIENRWMNAERARKGSLMFMPLQWKEARKYMTNKSLFHALESSPVVLLVSHRQQWSGNWTAWSHTIYLKTHRSKISWRSMHAPRPPSLKCLCMHTCTCNLPSENPGYGPEIHGVSTDKYDYNNTPGHIHHCIRQSVDSPCKDGADAQYMQYLSKKSYNSTTNTIKSETW